MNDFIDQVERELNEPDVEFNSQFAKARKFALFTGVFTTIISLSILGFLGWVIIKIMSHFGVI